MSSAVITPVADEDLRHNPPSFGNDYGTACVSRIVRSAWGSGKNKGSEIAEEATSEWATMIGSFC